MVFNNSTNNLFREQKVVNSATSYVVLADDIIVNITDTAAPRTVTLPAPSTSNVGKFFLIKDTSGGAATNNITVSPASGNIDGAASHAIDTNLGFVSAYSDGTNYFIQSETGGSTAGSVDFIHAGLSVNFAGAGTIPFNTVLAGNISLASNQFTLDAGKTYLLEGHPAFDNTGSPGDAVLQWRNITGGSALIGKSGRSLSMSATSNFHSYNESAVAVITPGVSTLVELEVTSFSGPSQLLLQAATSAMITQLGSTPIVSPVDFSWNAVAGTSQAMANTNGYYTENAALTTLTLPGSFTEGQEMAVSSVGGAWTIAQNAGQTIHFGTSSTTTGAGGSLASTATRDGVRLLAVSTTDLNVLYALGSLTVS